MKRAMVALAVLLALAGCQTPAASPAGPASTTPSPGPAAVEWADNLCSVILEYDSTAPKLDMDSSTQEAMVAWLTTYLDTTSSRVTTAVGKLQGLVPASVGGGDEATGSLIDSLRQVGAIAERSKERITKVDKNDPTATRAALQDVAKDLQNLRTPVNPFEGMGAMYPDLQAAARSADNCTEITRARASRTNLPPLPSDPPTTGSSSSTTTTTTPPSTEPSFPTF